MSQDLKSVKELDLNNPESVGAIFVIASPNGTQDHHEECFLHSDRIGVLGFSIPKEQFPEGKIITNKPYPFSIPAKRIINPLHIEFLSDENQEVRFSFMVKSILISA